MSFDIKSLKEAQDKLEKLSDDAEKMDGQSIPLSEVLTDEFVKQNSCFDSLDNLIKKSGDTVKSQEEFEAIPDEEWNNFISKNTNFESWQKMINSAGAIYAKNKFGL